MTVLDIADDQLAERLQEALESYFDTLDDLNDTDTDDLSWNLVRALRTPVRGGQG